jgi:hypothetical protein
MGGLRRLGYDKSPPNGPSRQRLQITTAHKKTEASIKSKPRFLRSQESRSNRNDLKRAVFDPTSCSS